MPKPRHQSPGRMMERPPRLKWDPKDRSGWLGRNARIRATFWGETLPVDVQIKFRRAYFDTGRWPYRSDYEPPDPMPEMDLQGWPNGFEATIDWTLDEDDAAITRLARAAYKRRNGGKVRHTILPEARSLANIASTPTSPRRRLMADFKQVAQLKPLRSGANGDLQVNVTDSKAGRRLDIRSWVKSDTYTGPTQKGISVTLEEFEALIAQADEIRAAMKGGA